MAAALQETDQDPDDCGQDQRFRHMEDCRSDFQPGVSVPEEAYKRLPDFLQTGENDPVPFQEYTGLQESGDQEDSKAESQDRSF